MATNNKQSGFISKNGKIKRATGLKTKTDIDTQKEAKKYVNEDVPGYNKLFIATLIGLGFLLWKGKD